MLSLLFLLLFHPVRPSAEESSLFKDLRTLHELENERHKAPAPFYNHGLITGYLNMPSARMQSPGDAGFGFSFVPPYQIYAAAFQMYGHVELSLNYRIFHGITEPNFGARGFGDDADRTANFKFSFLGPNDGFAFLPEVAIGMEDFLGTRRFHSQYIVMTEYLSPLNLELSLGAGRKRIRGFFGGVRYYPLPELSLIAEYDAIDYQHHAHEHPKGRRVASRFNAGLSYLAWKTLELQVGSVRGEAIAGSASLRAPLGEFRGMLPKVLDPPPYRGTKEEIEPMKELERGLRKVGLDIAAVHVTNELGGKKSLWIKVINPRYRDEVHVRELIESVLMRTMKEDVDKVSVVIDAEGVLSHSFTYRRNFLIGYREGKLPREVLQAASPMKNVISSPSDFEGQRVLLKRRKIWTATFRPRVLSYFGSLKGKFKYTAGLIAAAEGYFLGDNYWCLDVAYNVNSSSERIGTVDFLNPSQLPIVRSDSVRYFPSQTVALDQAFVQKAWHMGKATYMRLASGYFEVAYGGVATELLYYPVGAALAVGVEAGGFLKRHYRGLGFTTQVFEFKNHIRRRIPYVGTQAFLNFYFDIPVIDTLLKVQAGQFLARDLGARFQAMRYFKSGLRFGLWFTATNGNDKVNGQTYFDKGFFISLPLDFFLNKSSRNFASFAMSAWLRDVGATASTGKELYPILWQERASPASF